MLNKISVGDARELSKRIDGDIALVICDPVYWEYWQYSFVAELGLSLLVPGGSVIAQAGDEHRLAAENALQIDGMINCPLIMEHMSGGFRQLWNTRSLAVIKPWLRIKKKE